MRSNSSALARIVTSAAMLAVSGGHALAQGGPEPEQPPVDDQTPPQPPVATDPPPTTPTPPATAEQWEWTEPAAPATSPKQGVSTDGNPDSAPSNTAGKSAFVVGVELGVGGVLVGGSDSYKPGLGRSLMIGYQRGRTSLEWHLSESFSATLDKELRAVNTASSLRLMSVGVRVEAAPVISLYGGFATAAVPLLVRGGTSGVRGDSLSGIGVTGGAALGWKSGAVTYGIELRLTQLVITDAVPTQVVVTGSADAMGAIPVMNETSSPRPLIGTLTATVRLLAK